MTILTRAHSGATVSKPSQHDREKAAATQWLQEQIKRARKTGKFAQWAVLTPAMAEVLIEGHMPAGTNRKLRQGHVNRIKSIIEGGYWDGDSHEGMAITTDGIVNDGQHRIHAVAACGVPVEVLMTFGQPRRTFEVINQVQAARNVMDLIAMDRLELGTPGAASGAARLILAIASGETATVGRFKISAMELLDYLREHANEFHSAVKRALRVTTKLRNRTSPSNLCAALVLIERSGADEDYIDSFVDMLASGADLGKTSPILALREGLRGGLFGAQMRSPSDRRIYEVAAILNAWNAWRANKAIKGAQALHWKAGTPIPVPVA